MVGRMQACSNNPSIKLKQALWKEPRRGTSKRVTAEAYGNQRGNAVNWIPPSVSFTVPQFPTMPRFCDEMRTIKMKNRFVL